jgi:hypothetical protein
MTISEIYALYQLPPNLRHHMLRVASVVWVITENWQGPTINAETLIQAALLHDVGNLVKYKLDDRPVDESDKPVEYWHKVQQAYWDRYGRDDAVVNSIIAREINAPADVIDLIRHTGHLLVCDLVRHQKYAEMILNYADLRVAMNGIVSMQERLDRVKDRYPGLFPEDSPFWPCSKDLEFLILENSSDTILGWNDMQAFPVMQRLAETQWPHLEQPSSSLQDFHTMLKNI